MVVGSNPTVGVKERQLMEWFVSISLGALIVILSLGLVVVVCGAIAKLMEWLDWSQEEFVLVFCGLAIFAMFTAFASVGVNSYLYGPDGVNSPSIIVPEVPMEVESDE